MLSQRRRPARRPLTLIRSLSLLVVLGVSACSDDGPAGLEAGGPADLQSFFATLPAWEVFSPPIPDADEPIGETTEQAETIGGTPHTCSVTPHSLASTPERVVTLNPDVEVLWVGSLLQGDGYIGGIGSLAELPIRQREPVALSIDLLTGANNQVVENPTSATVSSAIGQLINDAQDAGHQSGSNIFFTKETAYSLEQASLKMGVSASYMGGSAKASLAAKISEEKRSVTAYFVQRMFTVSQVLPQHPEEVFSEEFTQAMLDREVADGRMGEDNLPVFVSSISYGRIMMFTMTSTASADSLHMAASALYEQGGFGGGAELEGGLHDIVQNAEIQVVTVGGDAEQALALIRSNDLGAFFTEDAPLTTARPISYTIRNLADNSIAQVSETTEYNLTECTPDPPTGARYQVELTHLYGHTDADGYLHYTFYVQDSSGPTQAAHQPRRTIVQSNPFIDQGGIHQLNGRSPVTVEVYFDNRGGGRNQFRIHGRVPDLWKPILGGYNSYGPFDFSRVFSGSGARGLAGQYSTDGTYNYLTIASRLRLFFTITKLADLYD